MPVYYGVNVYQVENVDPKHGANFSGNLAYDLDEVFGAAEQVMADMGQPTRPMANDLDRYMADVRYGLVSPDASFMGVYGDYRLTVVPYEMEDEVYSEEQVLAQERAVGA